MKKLSKNKMAKLLATFLGASTILTPMVTLISCEQPTKTPPIVKQKQEKTKPNPEKPIKPEDPKPPVTPEDPKPPVTPEDPKPPVTPEQPQEELDAGSIFKLEENSGEFKLTGSICIDDINSAKFIESLKKAEGKNIDTSTFKINCFKTNISSPTGRNVVTTNSATQITAITITPDLLEQILKKGKDFSDLKLNNESNNKTVKVLFKSNRDNNKKDYFDISGLAKFTFNDKFELDNSSNIILGGEKKYVINEQGETVSHYPMISELMTLIQDNRLNDKMEIGSILLSGNVGEVLKYLNDTGISINGKTIKEVEEGESIKFLSSIGKSYSPTQPLCDTKFNTGYFGSGKNLSIEQLKQYYNRAESHAMQIKDTTIENLNSTNYNGDFVGDMLTNVNFVNSNLSKIIFRSCETGSGYLKFENSTLPKTMSKSAINRLILKNVTIPKEEILKEPFAKLTYIVPEKINSLEIYGEIKDSILDGATTEQLDSLVPQKNMPPKYKGSQEIYNRLKYIFNGESQIKDFGNYQGSIQKIKDQYLALIQNQGISRG